MQPLNPPADTRDLLLRLAAATIAGAIVGLNRDLHHKPAGLRTHALVGLGSAALVVVALTLTEPNVAAAAPVIQGIVTGIGFLGAGVILHQGERAEIHGLTTAATIWVTAALGIACGAGHQAAAGATGALMLLVLSIGGPIERFMHRLIQQAFPSDRAPEE